MPVGHQEPLKNIHKEYPHWTETKVAEIDFQVDENRFLWGFKLISTEMRQIQISCGNHTISLGYETGIIWEKTKFLSCAKDIIETNLCGDKRGIWKIQVF